MTELVLTADWFHLLRIQKNVGQGHFLLLKDGIRAWCDENIPGWDETKATLTFSFANGGADMELVVPVLWFKTTADHMLFVMRWRDTDEDDADALELEAEDEF